MHAYVYTITEKKKKKGKGKHLKRKQDTDKQTARQTGGVDKVSGGLEIYYIRDIPSKGSRN